MAAKKGVTNNPNGRPKGKPDKRTSELMELWEKMAYCPGREAIKALKELPPDLAAPLHIKLMKFKFPELKAVEHSVSDETFEKQLTYEEYLRSLK